MSRAFMEHLFEAFTREQDSRTDRIEGSGLGMCITKRLVDMLDGTITVESEPGKGTVFQVTLPMTPVPENDGPPLPDVPVLLADHDPFVLQYGAQELCALGIHAECAENIGKARAMVQKRHREGCGYRILILDQEMSHAQDLEQDIQLLKNSGDNLHLILSSFERNGIQKGPDTGFIEKPFFRSTFRNCLSEYLGGGRRIEPQVESHDFSGKTFLLAEDNELNREIAVELLGSMGAKLEIAVNGEEALLQFRQSPLYFYDLILMDIQMPLMNGYDAARAIRSLNRSDAQKVPIIAMTADAFVSDIQNAKSAGMNGHMAKPLDHEVMSREISKYLD